MVWGLVLMGIGAVTPFLANWLLPPKCAACPPGYIQHDDVKCGDVGRCEMGPALQQAILYPAEHELHTASTQVPFFENPLLIGGAAAAAIGAGILVWGSGKR